MSVKQGSAINAEDLVNNGTDGITRLGIVSENATPAMEAETHFIPAQREIPVVHEVCGEKGRDGMNTNDDEIKVLRRALRKVCRYAGRTTCPPRFNVSACRVTDYGGDSCIRCWERWVITEKKEKTG